MFRNIIVTVVLVSVFHLSIAWDRINPGDINSIVKLAKLTTDNGVQPKNEEIAIYTLVHQITAATVWLQYVLEYSLIWFEIDIQVGKQSDLKVQKLQQYQTRIDQLFLHFRSYERGYRNLYNDDPTIYEFLTTCTSNDTDGLQETLRNIYLLVMSGNVGNDSTNDLGSMDTNFFQYIQQILDGAPLEKQCNRGISVYQRLYETYNSIIIMEAKGHIMSMFSYRLQKIKQNVSNEQEMKKAGANLVMRAEEYLLALKKSLPAASRTHRRCDPRKQRSGKTFIELGTLERCQGNCGTVRSQVKKNDPGKVLLNRVSVFSMRPRLSNIDANMVITGVRIAEYTRVIQIEIIQGKLLPNGRIERSTEIWVENEQFEYTQEVYGGGFYLLKDGDEKELLNITDDYTFIWSKQKILNLDELYWEPNYVVTGIKFGFTDPEKVDEHGWNLSPIQLEIRVTEFDYNTGLLKTESDSSQWITAEKMKGRLKEYDNERTNLSSVGLAVPVKNPINVPDSTPNQRVTFGTSDYQEDAEQSTIPFLDSVPVMGLSFPIAGIGIFHKGASEYAGYISLRTYSVDLSNCIISQMKSNDADMYKADFSDPMPYDIEVEE